MKHDKKTVKKMKLGEESARDDLAYWNSRPVEERIAAVETLRREYYGSSAGFSQMFALLNRHKVEYVIVGSYALAFYGAPRNTGDIDIYVRPTPENGKKIIETLGEFGFASLGLTEKDFVQPGQVIQLGTPPVRIDFLTSITGVTWERTRAGKVAGKYGDIPVQYLGREQYVENKRSLGRKKDLADLEALGEE